MSRPVLLQHAFTYQSLVHEIESLELSLRKDLDILRFQGIHILLASPSPSPTCNPDQVDFKPYRKDYSLFFSDVFLSIKSLNTSIENLLKEFELIDCQCKSKDNNNDFSQDFLHVLDAISKITLPSKAKSEEQRVSESLIQDPQTNPGHMSNLPCSGVKPLSSFPDPLKSSTPPPPCQDLTFSSFSFDKSLESSPPNDSIPSIFCNPSAKKSKKRSTSREFETHVRKMVDGNRKVFFRPYGHPEGSINHVFLQPPCAIPQAVHPKINQIFDSGLLENNNHTSKNFRPSLKNVSSIPVIIQRDDVRNSVFDYLWVSPIPQGTKVTFMRKHQRDDCRKAVDSVIDICDDITEFLSCLSLDEQKNVLCFFEQGLKPLNP